MGDKSDGRKRYHWKPIDIRLTESWKTREKGLLARLFLLGSWTTVSYDVQKGESIRRFGFGFWQSPRTHNIVRWVNYLPVPPHERNSSGPPSCAINRYTP